MYVPRFSQRPDKITKMLRFPVVSNAMQKVYLCRKDIGSNTICVCLRKLLTGTSSPGFSSGSVLFGIHVTYRLIAVPDDHICNDKGKKRRNTNF